MSDPPILFTTSVEWTQSHEGVIRSPRKTDVAATCPPPFWPQGDTRLWSPEEFFVGAVELCLMMTFLYFADRGEFRFLSYKSRAEGHIHYIEGKARFTKILIYPRIEVADQRATQKAKRLLHGAERNCLVSNSVKCDIVIEPEIVVAK
ncbi:MAG: OsmC family protein [Candidatus Sumerlaeota bacterium]|nr:OsmC family protein [Candidatus Sumerlaeota bacterium]